MKYIIYVIGAILGLIIILAVVYFVLVIRLGKINNRLYKKQEEINISDKKNILIVYQPTRRKTTFKIKEYIKQYIIEKGYGYKITTLNANQEDYNKYDKTIFIMPVYFGEVHKEFIKKISNKKIKNLLIVYNGLNKQNNEDKLVKDRCISKYSKIKLHTTDIEQVISFLTKEGL